MQSRSQTTGVGVFWGTIADFETLHWLVEIHQSDWLLPGSVSRPQRDHESEPENAAGFWQMKNFEIEFDTVGVAVIRNRRGQKTRWVMLRLWILLCRQARGEISARKNNKHMAKYIVHTCMQARCIHRLGWITAQVSWARDQGPDGCGVPKPEHLFDVTVVYMLFDNQNAPSKMDSHSYTSLYMTL